MSLPPHITIPIQLGFTACLMISPVWCAETSTEVSVETIPEPATSILGLLGLCLLLLRRGKP